jgi:hypothetical protein
MIQTGFLYCPNNSASYSLERTFIKENLLAEWFVEFIFALSLHLSVFDSDGPFECFHCISCALSYCVSTIFRQTLALTQAKQVVLSPIFMIVSH